MFLWGQRDLHKVSKGLLRYSCNCGWIDTQHAYLDSQPDTINWEIGPTNLWKQLVEERQPGPDLNGRPAFLVLFAQDMKLGPVASGYRGVFRVHRGLSIERKRAIGLRIMLDVSAKFERLQASFPYGVILDSGFSMEDLVSNVIGYFKATYNWSDGSLLSACKVVSVQAAVDVYNTYSRGGLGERKSVQYDSPLYFPCNECSGRPEFPKLFQQKPANYGYDFEPFPEFNKTTHVGL